MLRLLLMPMRTLNIRCKSNKRSFVYCPLLVASFFDNDISHNQTVDTRRVDVDLANTCHIIEYIFEHSLKL